MKSRRRNIALTVAYDGTNYHGFQRQTPPTLAIQNVLEDKLQKLEEILTGYGQMIVELPDNREDQAVVLEYFKSKGLSITEVTAKTDKEVVA